jgi:hypothetical protein
MTVYQPTCAEVDHEMPFVAVGEYLPDHRTIGRLPHTMNADVL